MIKLTEVGLRLRPEKCFFARTEIEYLGHTLTPNGVKPNDARLYKKFLSLNLLKTSRVSWD